MSHKMTTFPILLRTEMILTLSLSAIVSSKKKCNAKTREAKVFLTLHWVVALKALKRLGTIKPRSLRPTQAKCTRSSTSANTSKLK